MNNSILSYKGFQEMAFAPTPQASLSPLLAKLKTTFQSGKTRDVEFRKTQLKQFWKLVDVSFLKELLSLWYLASGF